MCIPVEQISQLVNNEIGHIPSSSPAVARAAFARKGALSSRKIKNRELRIQRGKRKDEGDTECMREKGKRGRREKE